MFVVQSLVARNINITGADVVKYANSVCAQYEEERRFPGSNTTIRRQWFPQCEISKYTIGLIFILGTMSFKIKGKISILMKEMTSKVGKELKIKTTKPSCCSFSRPTSVLFHV